MRVSLKYYIIVVALLNVADIKAQILTGIVYDALTHQPLEGASVNALKSEKGAVTNAKGRFKITSLSPGRISIEITYVGYTGVRENDIWVKTGVVTNHSIYMHRSLVDLDEVIVKAPVADETVGEVSITEEQINRFAATYYDPARLITSVPDIAVTNDQNNQVSVRGLSPNYNVWRLEGTEIVNPNHLSNAGTFLDQPSATGGGVNMLSAQMLEKSTFLYSTFGNKYGNSVGGVFNMKLKSGNSQQRKYTAQASLIGFDLASEGPIKKGGKVTYAANYRYSFTGLLSNLGVDFGGEAIGFQDLSLTIDIPTSTRSSLKFYGVGGISRNDFTHKPYDDAEELKDRKDIFYDNKTAIIGTQFHQGFSHGKLAATLTYSSAANVRDQNIYALGADSLIEKGQTQYTQSILSFSLTSDWSLNKSVLSYGIMANGYRYGYSPEYENKQEQLKQLLFRPYLQLHTQISPSIASEVGLSASFSKHARAFSPRAQVNWQISERHKAGLAAGRYAQLLSPFNYYFSNPFGDIPAIAGNTDFEDFIVANRLTLKHMYQYKSISLKTELFNYYFPEVKTQQNETDEGTTYGVSLLVDKSFTKDYYARIGGSLFDSKIGPVDNFNNSQYAVNVAFGVDWDFSNATKSHRLSVNIRGMYQGGNVPYLQNTAQSGWTTPYENRFYYRLNPYRRFDIRLVWTSYKAHSTMSIALDLQNVANIQNESFQQFNPYTNEWEMQYQLGFIPILAYRVEW